MSLQAPPQIDSEPPLLGLMLRDDVPEGFEDEFLRVSAASGHIVRTERITSGPFASIEHYLPSAVMLFIATSYFGGPIAKAGERHFERFREAVKILWRRSTLLRTGLIGTPGKVSSERIYSMDFSIVGAVAPKIRFKLIIRLDASEADGHEAIDAFFELVRHLHEGTLSDSDLEALLTYRPVGGTVLVTFDGGKKCIAPVNGMQR